jgi:biotin transporter BioY
MVEKKELYKQYVFMEEEECSNWIVMMTVSGGYYFHYIYTTFMLPALEKQCHKKNVTLLVKGDAYIPVKCSL